MSEGEPEADEIHLSPARARELISAGAQLIDVRTEHEWEAGRIAGATRIELGELGERAGELDRDRAMVFYCRGGNRSAMATQAFREAGFDAHNIEGGLSAWSEAGCRSSPMAPTWPSPARRRRSWKPGAEPRRANTPNPGQVLYYSF